MRIDVGEQADTRRAAATRRNGWNAALRTSSEWAGTLAAAVVGSATMQREGLAQGPLHLALQTPHEFK